MINKVGVLEKGFRGKIVQGVCIYSFDDQKGVFPIVRVFFDFFGPRRSFFANRVGGNEAPKKSDLDDIPGVENR